METASFWTNIPTGIWVLGGALVGSMGTLIVTVISNRSEERKHFNQLVMNAAIENWKKGCDMAVASGKGTVFPLDAYIIHMMKLSELFLNKSLNRDEALTKLKELSQYTDQVMNVIREEQK